MYEDVLVQIDDFDTDDLDDDGDNPWDEYEDDSEDEWEDPDIFDM